MFALMKNRPPQHLAPRLAKVEVSEYIMGLGYAKISYIFYVFYFLTLEGQCASKISKDEPGEIKEM